MKIVYAKALPEYCVELRFEGGEQGTVDLSPLVGRGVFTAWLDVEQFKLLRVTSEGALEWPGELDLCPDSLYLQMTGKTPVGLFPALNQQMTHA